MPYTLTKALLWIVLAIMLGIVIGYLLRSVTASRQIRQARAGRDEHPDLIRLRQRVAQLEPVVAERDRLAAELAEHRREPAGDAAHVDPVGETVGADVVGDGSEPDLTEAAAVLGRPVRLDDLTVIEGIGPAIADLCQGIGVATWAEMGATEVSLLRTMLTDAGARYQVYKPDTWPDQAALLAAGRWADFVEFTARLDRGAEIDPSDQQG